MSVIILRWLTLVHHIFGRRVAAAPTPTAPDSVLSVATVGRDQDDHQSQMLRYSEKLRVRDVERDVGKAIKWMDRIAVSDHDRSLMLPSNTHTFATQA